MNQEKTLHRVPPLDSMYPLLRQYMEGEVMAPGIRSSEDLPIIAIYKQESKWVNKTIFSYVEKYPHPENPERRKPDFEVIVIRDSLPKNVREFVMWYEAHRLMIKPEDTIVCSHFDALVYAIQKCPSGIKTFLQYIRLEKANEKQEEVI